MRKENLATQTDRSPDCAAGVTTPHKRLPQRDEMITNRTCGAGHYKTDLAEGLGSGRPSDPMRFSHVSMTSFKFGNDATISIRPLGTHNTKHTHILQQHLKSRAALIALRSAASLLILGPLVTQSKFHLWTSPSKFRDTGPSKHTSRRERCALTAHSTGCTPLLLPAAALTASARIQSDPQLLCAALPHPPRPESCL